MLSDEKHARGGLELVSVVGERSGIGARNVSSKRAPFARHDELIGALPNSLWTKSLILTLQ